MVRAILDGRKTQTRRLVTNRSSDVCGSHWDKKNWETLDFANAEPRTTATIMVALVGKEAPYDLHLRTPRFPSGYAEGWFRVRPLIEPGDVLWVREAYCHKVDPITAAVSENEFWYMADGVHVVKVDGDGAAVFRADGQEASPWIPSIHMPRRAARLFLEVTGVRVERIQSISEADIRAEGFSLRATELYPDVNTRSKLLRGLTETWDKAYPGSWARNDWVWVYDFTQTKGRE